jgi:PKD repeat protein
LIKDTIAHNGPDFDCTAGASTCGTGSKPIENYMNYTPDTCMTKFTVEQVNRMRCSLINYRAELVDIEMGGNNPPTANFTSTANNLVVNFTDTSTDSDGTIAARAWTFGDGSTSTATNPSRTYAMAGTYTVTLKVTDNEGATATKTATVTVTAGGGGSGVLMSGVPVPNLSGATGTQRNWYIDVPAGATSVVFNISGGTGDADLYIKRGAAPTKTSYDYRPYLNGNNETVSISSPAADRYHVMLDGYSSFSGVTLVATINTGGGGGGYEETKTNLSATRNNSRDFTLAVPAGATNLKFQISGGTGDADLYIRRGAPPTTSQWDYRPYLNGNNETVNVASPQSGTWYIKVRAYATYSGVTLKVSYD